MTDKPKALRLTEMIEKYNERIPSEYIREDYQTAAAELRRLHEVNAELLEALRYCVGVLEQVDCSTGICCCGSDMQNHGMDDGHSPVDQGQYAQSRAIENGRAAIAKAEDKP
jgi:hypothetical protein